MIISISYRVSFLCLLGVMTSIGCSTDSLTPKEYVAWMTKHQDEVQFSQTVGDYQYQLQYLPHEWLSLKEVETFTPSKEQWKEIMNSYQGSHYFQFKISKPGIQSDILKDNAVDQETYYQNVSYCSFGLQKDLHFISGGDTLNCSMFHFERTYGGTPYLSFMLAFDTVGIPVHKNKYFLFLDPLFSDQEVKIELKPNLFENTPKIVL